MLAGDDGFDLVDGGGVAFDRQTRGVSAVQLNDPIYAVVNGTGQVGCGAAGDRSEA